MLPDETAALLKESHGVLKRGIDHFGKPSAASRSKVSALKDPFKQSASDSASASQVAYILKISEALDVDELIAHQLLCHYVALNQIDVVDVASQLAVNRYAVNTPADVGI